MKNSATDTIAAVATPPGEGAIAVIRVSGRETLRIGDQVCRTRRPVSTSRGYTVHHGTIIGTDGGEVDDVLVTVFRAPRSYTGEDVIEISCHGGLFVTDAVLNAVLSAGARRADPGEFTRRAFLNGKMDLSRAEAVGALISSKAERAHRASLDQLHGRLSGMVGELRAALKRLCALLELDLDFSEEGLVVIETADIVTRITEVKEKLEHMAATFRAGRRYRDGIAVVIVGPPNAGKSSLFNALLKESRAIVTSIPGTTRDYIEENVTLEGVLFRITDTAGLRECADAIESEGIARALRSLETADVVVLVVDTHAGKTRREGLVRSLHVGESQRLILVRNKIDLVPGESEGVSRLVLGGVPRIEVSLSALSGEGIHALTKELIRTVGESELSTHETVCVISKRHAESLLKSACSLARALEALRSGMTNEFVAFDLREALSALGEITGEITTEEILNSIFGEFCIGK
jgi:tRNA modification GTPase